MSLLQYGSVVLDNVRTLQYERLPIMDSGGTYLYTRVRLSVVGIYNPAVTSYTQVGRNLPQKGPGQFATVTQASLAHFLSIHRQTLTYRAGSAGRLGPIIFQCPNAKAGVDVKVGPIVTEAPTVEKMHGERTWEVRIGFECYVNENIRQVIKPSAVLSHRWTTRETVDQDGFATLQVDGRLVCRMDNLVLAGEIPDFYREFAFHLPQKGFKRSNILCMASEDGTTIEYSFIDREMPFTIVTPERAQVSRIEAVHFRTRTKVSAAGNLQQVAGGLWQQAMQAVQILAQVGGGGFGAGGAAGAAQGGGMWGVMANGFRNFTPSNTHDLVVRVWGNPLSKRVDLANVAIQIARARVADLRPAFWDASATLTEDVMGRFVEVRANFVQTAIGQGLNLFNLFGANGPFAALFNFGALPNEDIPAVLVGAPGDQPLVSGRKSRGRYASGIAAQALVSATATTPAPTWPGPSPGAPTNLDP